MMGTLLSVRMKSTKARNAVILALSSDEAIDWRERAATQIQASWSRNRYTLPARFQVSLMDLGK
jgi:hypothetical protein